MSNCEISSIFNISQKKKKKKNLKCIKPTDSYETTKMTDIYFVGFHSGLEADNMSIHTTTINGSNFSQFNISQYREGTLNMTKYQLRSVQFHYYREFNEISTRTIFGGENSTWFYLTKGRKSMNIENMWFSYYKNCFSLFGHTEHSNTCTLK